MIQSKDYIIHQIADDYRTKINLVLIGGYRTNSDSP